MATLFLQTGRTRSIPLQATVTPTPDRLAPPTLPATPLQADYGAKEFWSRCLPCHGERGQGLTDEFRQTYPPEDQNCWMSGCHGARPYPDGWTIPTIVPPVIGPTSLIKFQNAQVLHDYICAAMPYQWPGTLADETCWQLTAYLTRQNGLWDGAGELNQTNAAQLAFLDPSATPASLPASTPTPTAAPTLVPAAAGESNPSVRIVIILAAAVLVLIFSLFFIRRGLSG